MTQKMKFAVEDIQLIDDIDKSQFSLLKVDAFATGRSAHDTFITEENLRKTSATIIQKPFVFVMDNRIDDIGGHDDNEVAAGFVPHNSPLEFTNLPDGRIMMSCQVLIWKRYSGKLIDYFERDGGKKGVSVEIEIVKSKTAANGLLEILDLSYNAITCLGDFISPAIPNAQAVMQFSKDYSEAKKEYEVFSRYDEVDMTIPEEIKQNAQNALDSYKESGAKVSPVAVATAKYLVKNEKITPQRIRQLHKNVHNKKMDEVSLSLWGGATSKQWSEDVVKLMDEIDIEQSSFFAEKVDNTEAEQNENTSYEDKNEKPADGDVYMTEDVRDNYLSINEEVEKNMADKKDKKDEADMAAEVDAKEKEDMAADADVKEKDDAKEDMAAEEPEKEDAKEDEKEDMAADKAVYSLNEYLDVAALLGFLKNETAQYREVKELEHANFDVNAVIGEIAKGKGSDIKTVTNGMLNHLKTLSKVALSAVKELKQFAEENKTLKEFKTKVETDTKDFEVKAVLKEAFEAGMPQSQIDECEAKAKDFSLGDIDQYKNMVKAKAFQYFGQRLDVKEDDGLVKAAYPFNERKNSEPVLWK